MNSPAQPAQPSCFVIMPFGGVADDYYAQIYSPAIAEAGLVPVRADDVFRAGSVLQDIVDLLSRSTVVLADISENNRNVHYELGLAHALGKPTLLVSPQDSQLFFDVGQERMITYTKENAFWGERLHETIVRALRGTMEDPSSAIPTAFMHLKPVRVEADEVVLRLRRMEELLFELVRTAGSAPNAPIGRMRSILMSLPVAEAEAERLLKTMDRESVLRHLVSAGYGEVMADAALATALKRAPAG